MSPSSDSQERRHPIQVVSRRTGLSADVLRAWERRYEAVTPERSETGRRLYSDADIERLRLLRRATLAGRRIGRVAGLSTAELADLVHEDQRAAAEVPSEEGGEPSLAPREHIEAAMEAVRRLDGRALESVLRRAVIMLGIGDMIRDVAAPLVKWIGESWSTDELEVAHEHLASAVMIRVLGTLAEEAEPPEGAPTLVVAAPAGERHELGALFAATLAASYGWSIAYLGSDIPASDIATVALERSARCIALSLVYARTGTDLADELDTLRREIAEGMPIVVGGAAAASCADLLDRVGAVHVEELVGFKGVLDEVAELPG